MQLTTESRQPLLKAKLISIPSNPILPGFHPDPSICRVGKEFYLATSSFEYFPGVPIFHSRDLINWTLIGHALSRRSQLNLEGCPSSGGIFAPSLRYHAGLFYLITTHVSGYGHFYVTVSNPAGPWSKPVRVAGPGFDPDLYFAEDGRVWFLREDFTGHGIRMQELDVASGQLLGEQLLIWEGHEDPLCEAPHLYRHGEWYYLIVAEGGTFRGHGVVVARSRHLTGPYEGCPNNPVLTHRHHVRGTVQSVGHADLVEDIEGNWWAVLLGTRPVAGCPSTHHLGRETFLVPVTWTKDEWPIFNEGEPVTTEVRRSHLLPKADIRESHVAHDDFDATELGLIWNYRRNPPENAISLSDRPGFLRLWGTAARLEDNAPLAFVGCRQQHIEVVVSTALDFYPTGSQEEAGLVVLMNERHYYAIVVTQGPSGDLSVCLRARIGPVEHCYPAQRVGEGRLVLCIEACERYYSFSIEETSGKTYRLGKMETRYLSTEVAGGFTGVYFGMFASGRGTPATSPADFDYFCCRQK